MGNTGALVDWNLFKSLGERKKERKDEVELGWKRERERKKLSNCLSICVTVQVELINV